MSYIPNAPLSLTSEYGVNSYSATTGPLWSGDVFTGLGEQNDYNYVSANLQVDEAGILTFQFSQDGTNWSSYPTTQFTVVAGINEVHGAWKGTRYVRPYFSGSTGTRTYFRLRTMYSYDPVILSAPINQSINSDSDATIVRSIKIGENPTGSYVNEKIDGVSFSTTIPLSANGVYQSSILSTEGFSQIQTELFATTTGTLLGEWFMHSTGGTVLRTFTRPYSSADVSSGLVYFSAPVFGPYVRYTYTNGATAQTAFYLSLKELTKPISGQIIGLTDFIPQSVVANLGRNVLVGQDEAGNFRNTGVDSEGHIKIHIDEPLTAFGELETAEPTPVAQVDFIYGINNQVLKTTTLSGATATSTDGMLVLSTSAVTGSSSYAYSNRYVKYRDGQGSVGRYTALFSSGVTGNNQYAGMFTPTSSNGFGFGYSGTTFGIWHRYSGTTLSFIPQSSWNIDTMDGSRSTSNPSGISLDPTKGNVYQVKFQYLGFGNVFFYIESPETGAFNNVHNIKYSNSNVLPSLRQPSLSLFWGTENVTNNTAIIMKGASGALFTEGKIKYLGPKYGIDNNKSLAAGTTTSILALKNATTYNGIVNRAQVRIRTISLASDMANTASGMQILQVHKNATLGGSPNFIPIAGTTSDNGNTITNGQSVISYDTAGTTITPVTGTTSDSFIVYNTNVGRNSNVVLDVSDLDIFMSPGDVLIFAIKTVNGGTQQSNVSVNWNEDI